ncbi:putative metal-dependent HD superfamily phosphohydrolase [Deinococcus metalli]|uniref:Putative metal-dependent HD superfamily phosphohydrolase n=1 Tax=Deinococcus metalli TaxID=1141878 RepID=A0A7W8KGC0_9DEIO|nr:phosphohydrolase [Deinococcus metalli]MBB5377400.1 putative metal-dependent HD superfamily phosphohydrolase [Deinococcus metalli]GHF50132.1 hypothetical protein GCM10017781_28280 [Deinococcus metalli]
MTPLADAEAFARPRYAEAHRHYHTAAHIQAVIDALDARGVLTPAMALAAWGHDLIYDPRASDNEERSADEFDGWLAAQGAADALRRDVRALILATRHTSPPATRAEALFVDADLSILGAAREAFGAYDRAIRKEYAHVPDDAYREGRAQVLRHFLNRERIYTTPEFSDLEPQARANLQAAVAQLTMR